MIQVQIDEDELKAAYLQKLDEKMKEIEDTVFFMNSKQLQKYLNMSWSSIVEHLLHEEDFGAIRLGAKWLFNKRQVDCFMETFYKNVRSQGGEITSYTTSKLKEKGEK